MATEIRCDASIRVRDIPGEVLVLDRRNDRVHQLHPTSRLIWRHLDQVWRRRPWSARAKARAP